MKKINKLYTFLLGFVAISVLFTACSEDDNLYDAGDAFHFSSKTISVFENAANPIVIPVVFTKTSAIAGSVTVSVTSSTATLNQDYVVLSPSLTLDYGPNDYFDTIYIQTIDNSVVNPVDMSIDVVISSATANAGYPGLEGGTSFDSLTINIIDDDCPLESIARNYSVFTTYGFHDFLPDYSTNTMDMTVTANADGTYQCTDFSGGLYGSGPYVAAYGTGPLDQVVFSENNAEISWTGQSDPWGALIMAVGGTNSVDPCTGVMTISWFCEGYGENGVSVYTPQ